MGKLLYKTDWCRIHLCKSYLTKRERAVKIIREASGSVHEFEILKETDHPNLPTMYELFQGKDDEFYIVMNYCDGGTLSDTLAGKQPAEHRFHMVEGVFKGGTTVFIRGGHGLIKGGSEAIVDGISTGINEIQELQRPSQKHLENEEYRIGPGGPLQSAPSKNRADWAVTGPGGLDKIPVTIHNERDQSRNTTREKSPRRGARQSPNRRRGQNSQSPVRGTGYSPSNSPGPSPTRMGTRGPKKNQLVAVATETDFRHKTNSNNKTKTKLVPCAPSQTKSPLNEDDCKLIMLQLLSCLNYCHKNGIMHCVVKTGNIMFDYDKDITSITLIDFDCAYRLTNQGERLHYQRASSTGHDVAYLAPEVVQESPSYDAKSDIWSCGVVLYEMLSNTLPFVKSKHDTEEDIRRAILSKEPVQFPESDWVGVSDDAKEFIDFLLTVETWDRPTAHQAVTQNWLYGARARNSMVFDDAENSGAARVLHNLRKFNAADTKMKEAVCAFIVFHLLTDDEMRRLDQIFQALDTQHDGRIRRYELKHAYYQVHKKFITDSELDKIMNRIDLDGNNEISYSEFCMAALSKKDLLSKVRLKSAFQLFDKQGKGFVTNDELRDAFRFADMDASYLNKLIRQVDIDGDGKITFDEFVSMMTMEMSSS